MFHIEVATDMRLVRELFEEYACGLHLDLSFQDFHGEIDSLPGDYEPILIAFDEDSPAGCVAVRRLDATACEMKRLYVRERFRGREVGRYLAEAAVAAAKTRGFLRMRLDTLPSMTRAIALYESLGFREIEPYRFNPVPGARFMQLDLATSRP